MVRRLGQSYDLDGLTDWPDQSVLSYKQPASRVVDSSLAWTGLDHWLYVTNHLFLSFVNQAVTQIGQNMHSCVRQSVSSTTGRNIDWT